MENNKKYWDSIADIYQDITHISTNDFHFGPLVPGDKSLNVLPDDLKGMKCLEIGCGAAQNSIYLAKQGADCTAFDISEEQIKHAHDLMKKEGVEIQLKCTGMDHPEGITGKFDLIHSVYAISFAEHPAEVVKFAASHLSDNGKFLLATSHPLAQGEWLDVEDEQGLFLPDYFNVPVDIRYDDDGSEEIRSVTYPVSTVADWIYGAGMCIERILEPVVNPTEVAHAPYYSDDWIEYLTMFSRVPSVIIFLCHMAK